MCLEYILDDCIGTLALICIPLQQVVLGKISLLKTHRIINVCFSNYIIPYALDSNYKLHFQIQILLNFGQLKAEVIRFHL